jgi:CheY-like chemotaxis protein
MDRRVDESPHPTAIQRPQPSSLRKWILVADDEKALRLLLVRVLTDAGYTVVTARHGIEALELARQVFPHLIILDLRMPRRSGLEVLANLRQVPVIILSGYLRDLPPELASRPNVVAMLEKPVTLDVLRSTVRDALKQSESIAEAGASRPRG